METYMLLLDIAVLLSVGIALAMFGGGGAVILIPYLTQVAGYPLDEAVLLSLLTIGINTGIKTFKERSSIDWKAVLTFSLLSFPTAAISGSLLAPITPDSVRMTVFGAFTLTVATLMFFPINQAAFSRKNPIALSASALLTGVICGLIGVGGGIFIATALLYILVLIAGGMMVGKKLKAATSDRNLKSGFAVFLVLIGIWVLLRA